MVLVQIGVVVDCCRCCACLFVCFLLFHFVVVVVVVCCLLFVVSCVLFRVSCLLLVFTTTKLFCFFAVALLPPLLSINDRLQCRSSPVL